VHLYLEVLKLVSLGKCFMISSTMLIYSKFQLMFIMELMTLL